MTKMEVKQTDKYVLNITLKIDRNLRDQWYQWLTESRIPELMRTGCFSRFMLLRIAAYDDSQGFTYALQLFISSLDSYDSYKTEFERNFALQNRSLWGLQMVCFDTFMEILA